MVWTLNYGAQNRKKNSWSHAKKALRMQNLTAPFSELGMMWHHTGKPAHYQRCSLTLLMDTSQQWKVVLVILPVNFQMPSLDFAVNHYGKPDVAMFDFTSMFQSDNSCRVIERHGHRLLMSLVGDSLLEPFWPTGTGCARGFFGGLDACWLMRQVGLLFLFLMFF